MHITPLEKRKYFANKILYCVCIYTVYDNKTFTNTCTSECYVMHNEKFEKKSTFDNIHSDIIKASSEHYFSDVFRVQFSSEEQPVCNILLPLSSFGPLKICHFAEYLWCPVYTNPYFEVYP